MEFNLDTCKYVVWGFKNAYHTHSHIHEGFYRTLKLTGKNVLWLDQADDISGYDFSNTLFIGEHTAVERGYYWPSNKERIGMMPVRDDCFYVIHGDRAEAKEALGLDKKNWLMWDVFINQRQYETPKKVMLAPDMPFYPEWRRFDMRWATDMVPFEIAAMKPDRVFNRHSRVINWVGTKWHVNQVELGQFKDECERDGVQFRIMGAGQHGECYQDAYGHSKVVTVEANIRLVQDSYMAPAISGTHHITEGYAPCRIFKNISYGQYGITNSAYVRDLFDVPVIFESDPAALYHHAKQRLAEIPLKQLHDLMDEVAQKHTYLNRLDGMYKAIRMQQEGI